MTRGHSQEEHINAPNFSPRLWSITLLVVAIVLTGIWLVSRFAAMDLARDMQNWQEKLNLIAESRTEEVNKWVSGHFKDMRSLADNPSLQLYLTELETFEGAKTATGNDKEPAQKSYLRNLLLFTAERTGFASSGTAAIRANVPRESKSGLAVIGKDSQLIVSTAMMPDSRDRMIEQALRVPAGEDGLIDLQKDKDGTVYMGFTVPIFSIQGDRSPAAQIGRVAGIKTIDANLFGLLKHPGTTEATMETLLVRAHEGGIEYLSPLQDGTGAVSKNIDKDLGKLAESALMKTPGGFLTDKEDYRRKPVLSTSRPIAGTPWTLIVKIDRAEALAESTQRRASLIVFFFLIIAIIVLMVVAVWWHAHSRRAMMMSFHFRRMANKAMAQEQLLRLVADHQPEPIYIVDHHNTYRFANRQAANEAGMSPDAVLGKSLADMRGAARAEHIAAECRKTLSGGTIAFDVQHVERDDGEEQIIRSAFVPLAHIPVAELPKPTPGVLVVEQDISEVVHEREQRLATHHQLVQTLVKLVDKRDPFAANHSLLVSHLAFEVASDMELDNSIVETARFAGGLMNIGKIVVPPELLTKNESLTAEEKRIIRDSMNAAAELVKDISFDGPVAETLRQWQEKWDGSGPLGLQGEDILLSARIIAAANAFVGMISPRSWRTAIPIELANKFLLDHAGTLFDRRVVVALINYVENHSGKAWLKQILDSQRSAA